MRRAENILRNRHFWLILLVMLGISFIYYLRAIPPIEEALESIGYPLTRHTVQRYLFILPTVYATLAFGIVGGILSLSVSLLIMLPRALFISRFPIDATLETLIVICVAAVISWVLLSLERARALHQKAIRRLEAIHAVSDALGSSFEIEDILDSALAKVLEVTGSDAGFICVLDESKQKLSLAAHKGIPSPIVNEMNNADMGEGPCGQVAMTGEPVLLANPSADSPVSERAIPQKLPWPTLIVPLKAKGKLKGTMTLVRQGDGQFGPEEVALISTLGNYIGMAIENSQLYRNWRFYVGQITQAQEEERKRIARELHDETIQAMLVLRRQLTSLIHSSEPLSEPAIQRLKQALQLNDEILAGLRRFAQDLRPAMIDDLGLLPTLETLVANLQTQMNAAVRLEVIGEARRLSPEAELVLFRIAQEALSNVRRHAKASEVVTTVEFVEGRVTLTIQDNGQGFLVPERVSDLAASGKLGLMGMHERVRLLNGTLTIRSELGKGTIVRVEIPT